MIKENRCPIMNFISQEQAEKCLREWQHRLFLDSWFIKINLVSVFDIPDQQGANDMVLENKSCIISIAIDISQERFMMKVPNEKTLVHELLHCKYGLIDGEKGYEAKMLEIMEHQLIEEMSKSLIMAKYDLPREWFRNY